MGRANTREWYVSTEAWIVRHTARGPILKGKQDKDIAQFRFTERRVSREVWKLGMPD